MRTEWVVLADTMRARIFARTTGAAGWQDVRSLPKSAERNDDGRELRLPAAMARLTGNPGGSSSSHDDFIDQLAHELRLARKRGDYETVTLVAPAPVLAALNVALDSATRRTVAASISENLMGLPLRDARSELKRRF